MTVSATDLFNSKWDVSDHYIPDFDNGSPDLQIGRKEGLEQALFVAHEHQSGGGSAVGKRHGQGRDGLGYVEGAVDAQRDVEGVE